MEELSQNTSKTLKSSRIPTLQRTPSLRLKGEKLFGAKNSDFNYERNYFLNGNATLNGKSDASFVRNNQERNVSSKPVVFRSKLTRSASLSDKMHLNDQRNKEILKCKSLNHQQNMKIRLPLEFDSISSTPAALSPEIDDTCSVTSFRSCSSSMSLDAACSGYAGKKKKFVVHCSHHMDQDEYLTPTQRKDRQIRQLKAQLMKARREVENKEAEILYLTKEVFNLKGKVSNISANFKSEGSENKTTKEVLLDDVFQSNADSGLCVTFDEYKESDTVSPTLKIETHLKENTNDFSSSCDRAFRRSIDSIDDYHKKELEELKRNHSNEYQELKEKHNDRIESLLQKLSDANIKYFDLRPQYDRAMEILAQKESQIARLQEEVEDQDKRHHQMYLKMYKKGQEAAKFEHADEVLEFAHQAPKRVSVPELLQQLKVTEHELDRIKALYRRELYKRSDGIESEMTLRFLKDVIYHFLTNKDSRDHLRAIENIMGYSDSERVNIERSVFVRELHIKCSCQFKPRNQLE